MSFPQPGPRRASPNGDVRSGDAEQPRLHASVATGASQRRPLGVDQMALQADPVAGRADASDAAEPMRGVSRTADSMVRGSRSRVLPELEGETDVREVREGSGVSEVQHRPGSDQGPDSGSGGTDRLSEPRKYRYHANAKSLTREDRRFDQTALHAGLHGKQISHADYLAHCEKYDFAWRSIKKGDRILDVGCGSDYPLLKAINFVQAQATKLLYSVGGCYVGVDLNKLKPSEINWGETIGELDITSQEGYERALYAIPGNTTDPSASSFKEPLRGYTLIVCLEVIEHMDVPDGRRLLENLRDLLSPEGRIILSTPVYDGKAQARNHIHEYYIEELRELIESVGLVVQKRMGTFTAEPQLKAWMKQNRPDWYDLYMEAREFHSSGYMSGVMAPMVPDIARNNVWLLTKDPSDG